MTPSQIKDIFEQQAPNYDAQWAKTAPIRDALLYLLNSYFADLPEDAHILGVGVGTGVELAHLAQHHPGWRFTAVEPAAAMLAACRKRAETEGFADRCDFVEGYVDALPDTKKFDAATCFLVSQFILDTSARSQFFAQIQQRLKPGGLLASSDLASDIHSHEYEVRLRTWVQMLNSADVPDEMIERIRKAYSTDVALLSPEKVADIIRKAGFESVVPFYQAGLIHGWVSQTPGDFKL